MKKAISFILTMSFLLFIPFNAYCTQESQKCKSSILMCLNTGDVIVENNANERLYPASVTKIMSMLLFLEAIDSKQIKLTDMVTASENAVSKGGSQIWLEVGEQMSVEDLLKAIIISSANDACTCLSEYVSGSAAAFVDKMNKRAEELGLNNTHFENCTGLDDDTLNHYSSAYDLAVIAREVMKHELVTKYSTVWLDSLRGGKTELNNTNKLINKFNGLTGLKTGTTSKAGFCLCATAERDGLAFVSVVLGADTSDDRFNISTDLLEYGFSRYRLRKIEIDNSQINEVKIKGGIIKSIKPGLNENTELLLENEIAELEYEYKTVESVQAPVSSGDILGEVIVKSNDKKLMSIPLKVSEDIKEITFKDIFIKILNYI